MSVPEARPSGKTLQPQSCQPETPATQSKYDRIAQARAKRSTGPRRPQPSGEPPRWGVLLDKKGEPLFTRISLGVLALVRDRWITAVDFVVYQAHLEILNLKERRGDVSIKTIQELTGYNKLTIMRSRTRLAQVGLLQFEGAARKILYVVAPMENWFTTVNQTETVDEITAINQQRFTTVNQTPAPSPYMGSRESREKSLASSRAREGSNPEKATSTASPSPSKPKTEKSEKASPKQHTSQSAPPPTPSPTPDEVAQMREWLEALRKEFPQMGPRDEPPGPTPRNAIRAARRRDPSATPEAIAKWLRHLVFRDHRGGWDHWGGIVYVIGTEYPISGEPTNAQDTSPLAQGTCQSHRDTSGDTQITPEAQEWLRGLPSSEYWKLHNREIGGALATLPKGDPRRNSERYLRPIIEHRMMLAHQSSDKDPVPMQLLDTRTEPQEQPQARPLASEIPQDPELSRSVPRRSQAPASVLHQRDVEEQLRKPYRGYRGDWRDSSTGFKKISSVG